MSHLHEVIIFTTLGDEEMFYRDQVASKHCYLATVSTKAVMKSVQLVEEEREMLEDVGIIPKKMVVKDLILYELDEPSSDHFFLVVSNIKERERIELVDFLKLNVEKCSPRLRTR